MAGAFQSSAFQNSAFQTGVGITPPVVTPPVVGGLGKKRRRHHRITVEIDGEEFEVSSIEEGRELLLRAREMAADAAAQAAEQAAQKAAKRDKPAAIDRALAIPVPQIKLYGDGSDLLMQQLRASVDAAQAAIEAIYEQAMAQARIRYAEMLQDEEDVAMLLLL